MASTYSPTLRIELIGDGDQSGIWGQTTNNNLGSLLEQAITGVITIVMADTSYVLTNYNGVVDEARNAVIIATGTNSAQRDIVAPLVEKIYTIKNSTIGGYAVRIIGISGTGVTIPNGVTTSVFCDGTNFYSLQVGTTGNETINGNLTVTGTTSLGGALSGTTATFSGAISSVSPSFTGTPTAPTAPNGTSTTQIATTAFVQNFSATLGTMSTQNANNVAITGGTISGLSSPLPVLSGGTGVTTSTGSGNNVLSASPALTGTPTAPTQAAGTNDTSIATTAFAIANGIPLGGTGIGVRTSSTTTTLRSITAGTGISVSNGDGVSGNPAITNTGVLSANSQTGALTISSSAGITTTTGTGTIAFTPTSGYNGYGVRTVSTSAPSGGNNGDIWYQV